MNKYEYREPEFKVIRTAKEDVLTASGNVSPVGGSLDNLSDDWDGGNIGFGVGV